MNFRSLTIVLKVTLSKILFILKVNNFKNSNISVLQETKGSVDKESSNGPPYLDEPGLLIYNVPILAQLCLKAYNLLQV